MITITVAKHNGQYLPQLTFIPNAEFSIKQLAMLIMLLKSGQLANELLDLAKQELSKQHYDQCTHIINKVASHLSTVATDEDSQALEDAKKAAIHMEPEQA